VSIFGHTKLCKKRDIPCGSKILRKYFSGFPRKFELRKSQEIKAQLWFQ